MSEEKPTFKITDRRLFNPDGTPREDVVREEEPAPTPAPAESHEAAAHEAPADTPHEEAHAGGAAQAARERDASAATETMQEFLMLVEFVASFAADAMGMVGHPGEVGSEPNLPLARQCIDMLGALKLKTRGQLSAEEQRFLDALLTQLRMQYVSLTSGPRGGPAGAGPRGFSGGDITGGR
jgi:hypothetical protein